MHFPKEDLTSGRPQRIRESYEQQRQQGAVFGVSFGWENPQYFAESEAERDPGYACRRAKWFRPVGREVQALRARGGIIDTSPYAKYLVGGPEAEAWPDGLVTNRLPQGGGRITLCPMVNDRGRLLADFTVTKLASDRFLLVGAGAAVKMHQRLLQDRLPEKVVIFEHRSEAWAGFSLSGPRARAFLSGLSDAGLCSLGFLAGCAAEVLGQPAVILRLSFNGELGFEVLYLGQGLWRGLCRPQGSRWRVRRRLLRVAGPGQPSSGEGLWLGLHRVHRRLHALRCRVGPLRPAG